jgi:rod shape-determining protein MreC
VYDRQVRRRRAVLALLVVVSLILLTAYFGESSGSPLHAVQRGVIQVLSPVQEGASRALKPVRDLFGWFGDTFHAKAERDQLVKQRNQLLKQVVDYKVALEENARLRELVALDRSNGLAAYEKRTARIIGRSPNNLFKDTLEIDVGSDDGVRTGQAVIAGEGLVGHVSDVGATFAIVTLLTDPGSSIGAKVLDGTNAGDAGLVVPSVGDPTNLLLQLLPRDAPVQVGQPVVTSGWGADGLRSLYPPNILIGRVTDASPEELASSQQVHLSPIVDLRHIDFVQVLVGRAKGDGGVRAQVP